jgi:hypothetical protein
MTSGISAFAELQLPSRNAIAIPAIALSGRIEIEANLRI